MSLSHNTLASSRFYGTHACIFLRLCISRADQNPRFTWFQVGLYDVRFSMDSILARVAKLCHFAVMLGFAAVSVNFSVGDAVDEYSDHDLLSNSSLKVLTLFLMGDRLVLFCQYLSTIGMCRGYRRAVVPLCWISGIYFVAAMVYLGLYWTFDNSPGQTNYTYLVWYVVAVLETLVVTLISMVWRVISFKGTHLVERMSLLTLIIFGEGVIGLVSQPAIFWGSHGVLISVV